MNEQETEELVKVVAARYPRTHWGESPESTLRAWQWTLADVPFEAAAAVCQRWFKVKRFPPDPSEIREEVLTMAGLVPDPHEAWRQVRERARDWYPGIGWRNGVEPPALPEPVMTAIAAIGGIHRICEGTIDREGFEKIYQVHRARYTGQVDIASSLGVTDERVALEEGVS